MLDVSQDANSGLLGDSAVCDPAGTVKLFVPTLNTKGP